MFERNGHCVEHELSGSNGAVEPCRTRSRTALHKECNWTVTVSQYRQVYGLYWMLCDSMIDFCLEGNMLHCTTKQWREVWLYILISTGNCLEHGCILEWLVLALKPRLVFIYTGVALDNAVVAFLVHNRTCGHGHVVILWADLKRGPIVVCLILTSPDKHYIRCQLTPEEIFNLNFPSNKTVVWIVARAINNEAIWKLLASGYPGGGAGCSPYPPLLITQAPLFL